jgi:hypothetical protein
MNNNAIASFFFFHYTIISQNGVGSSLNSTLATPADQQSTMPLLYAM